MKRLTVVAIAICLSAAIIFHVRAAFAYQTQNVVVLVLCGVRTSETVLDPTHQYIPNIWNNLRTRGFINTEMQTFADPTTIQGHFAILTGSWSKLATLTFDTDEYRAHEPTLFEYILKGLNWPVGKAYAIADYMLAKENYSQHPLYGKNYGAIVLDNLFNDRSTEQQIYYAMNNYHPSLIFATFKGADYFAHRGEWNNYLSAIMTQDEIINDIWGQIESDPYYAGKTTLFVIGDHGRHDDQNGGFQSHGGTLSDGDRHVIFLAMGPDINNNIMVSSPRELIDLLPTIGELMSVPTSFAEGRVMWEILKGARTFEKRGKYNETNPDVVFFNNRSHIVYQKTPFLLTEGNEEIFYYSVDKGQKINNSKLSGDFLLSLQPAIAASSSGIHMVYTGWLPSDGTYNNTTWQHIYYRKSIDNGYSWMDLKQISSEGKPFWIEKATIDAEGANIAVVCTYDKSVMGVHVSTDGGNSWKENNILAIIPRMAETLINGNAIYIVFHDVEILNTHGGNRDIYIAKSDDFGETWSSRSRLTVDIANDLNPDIAVSGTTVHIVWENNAGGIWQVYYKKSSDGGNTWGSATKLTSSSVGAQNPRIELAGSKVVVAWEDFRNGKGGLYMKRSLNEGVSWSNEFKPVSTSGMVRNMDLATDGNIFNIVWEENRTGAWRIFVGQLL